MFQKAKSGRDAFAFSLRGMSTIASFGPVSASADDRINKVIDQRLAGQPENQPDTIREIENLLARYYAPGCPRAA